MVDQPLESSLVDPYAAPVSSAPVSSAPLSSVPMSGQNSNKFAPNRKYYGLTLLCITCIFTMIGDIGMAITYDFVGFKSNEVACAIQSSFGMFIVCTLIEGTCLLIQLGGIFCQVQSWQKSDFYRINILCHLLSSLGFVCALTIFGYKLSTHIRWFYWFELIGALICIANLAMWFTTQIVRRYVKRM